MPKRSTIPALALAALALSACGSSSSSSSSSSGSSSSQTSSQSTPAAPGGPSLSAFKTGFAKDKAQFTKLGKDLGVALLGAGKKSNSQLNTEFNALAARTEQQQAALRKLDPPAQFKDQLDELTAAFGPVSTQMKAIAAAAASGNAAAARTAATRLVKDSQVLKTVDLALSGRLGLKSTP